MAKTARYNFTSFRLLYEKFLVRVFLLLISIQAVKPASTAKAYNNNENMALYFFDIARKFEQSYLLDSAIFYYKKAGINYKRDEKR